MGRKRKPPPGMSSLRPCHDCGKPTSDYRCPRCHRRWLESWMADRDLEARDMGDMPIYSINSPSDTSYES